MDDRPLPALVNQSLENRSQIYEANDSNLADDQQQVENTDLNDLTADDQAIAKILIPVFGEALVK